MKENAQLNKNTVPPGSPERALRWAQLRGRKYLNDQVVVKEYGGEGVPLRYKVVAMACVRQAGVEDPDMDDAAVGEPPGPVNDCKLGESLARARGKIYELAYCNSWEWFFTGTLDPQKFNRADLEGYHKSLTQWLQNLRKRKGCDIRFLLVPELHKDGISWHIHGLLMGLPEERLHRFRLGDRMGRGIAQRVRDGVEVYDWPDYRERYGWCSLERVRSREAVSGYMTKYICKDIGRSVTDSGAHLYYRSRGLREAKKIARGDSVSVAALSAIPPAYAGDYATIWWLSSEEVTKILVGEITGETVPR